MTDRRTRSALRHEPGLDGIRAVAVAMAVLTHAGFAWAPGGFVGVSLFFTLSGYLITTLLLTAEPGRAGLGRFWVRRFRRLLPPLVVVVAATLVLATITDLGPSLSSVRADALASLAYVANWHFLASGQSYEAIFTAPTPLRHLWSLAIEEQFYVFFPLVVLGLRTTGWGRRRLAPLVVALWASAVAANLVVGATEGVDTTYQATHARVSEILAGAVLAVLVPGLLARERIRPARWAQRSVAAATAAAVAAMTVIFLTVRDTDPAIAEGLLPALAVANAVLVAGVLTLPRLARALSWEPIAFLGRISYALYLVHWPVFVWLSPGRVGLDGAALFAVRMAMTLPLTVALHVVVENPIRRGVLTPRRMAPVAVALATAVALVFAPIGNRLSPVEAAEAELAELLQPASASAAEPAIAPAVPDAPVASARDTTSSTTPHAPVVVAMFGDSTAFFTQLGLARWAGAHPAQMTVVPGETKIGCPLVRVGRHDFQRGEVPTGAECDWASLWPEAVAVHRPDVAVVQVGPWEVAEFRLTSDDEWTRIGDEAYDRLLRAELTAAAGTLAAGGATVVFLSSPYVEVGRLDLDRTRGSILASEPWRMDRFNHLLGEVVADLDGVEFVDLAAVVAELSDERVDADLFPDGLHFTGDSAELVAATVAPMILEAAR